MKKFFLLLSALPFVTLICVNLITRANNGGSETFSNVPNIDGKAFDTYDDRIRTLAAACQRFKSENVFYKQDVDPTKYMRLDRKHNVAFCPLFKSATSTILALFVKMSTSLFSPRDRKSLMHNHDQLHERTKEKLRYVIRQNNSSSEVQMPFTFVFVRHPFGRLVSAFEDKMLYNTSPINLRAYSKMREMVNGSFVRFVDIVLKKKHCLNFKSNCYMDSHWRPFYGSCRHCETTYDIIGRVETLWEDWRHLCRQANMSGCQELAEQFINKRMNSHATSLSGQERTLSYFKQLSSKRQKDLYEFYKLDFEMFGYRAFEYLK